MPGQPWQTVRYSPNTAPKRRPRLGFVPPRPPAPSGSRVRAASLCRSLPETMPLLSVKRYAFSFPPQCTIEICLRLPEGRHSALILGVGLDRRAFLLQDVG